MPGPAANGRGNRAADRHESCRHARSGGRWSEAVPRPPPTPRTAAERSTPKVAHDDTPFTLSGRVRAAGDPIIGGDPNFHFAKCTGHFPTGAADVLDPTGVPVPFGESHSLSPVDDYSILCAVHRGSAASQVFPADGADIEWGFTMTFGAQ